jgi:TPR repeat protein
MRLIWKIATPVLCLAVIGGAAIAWQVYKAKTNEQKLAEEARVCRVRAEQGDARAQSDLGNMYYYGRGVPQDYVEAARLYGEAADQGDAKAEEGLAALYYHGYGVPQDRAEATRWLRKAADQGSEYAQHSISIRLTTSRLVLLWAQVILCLWLSLGFLLPNSFKPSRGLRDVRQSVISGTGVLGLFSAGLDWYGYTYYKIRCLNCGLNTFTWLHWLLNGVLLILLICIAYILPAKKPEAQEYEIAAEETAEGSSADKELWL